MESQCLGSRLQRLLDHMAEWTAMVPDVFCKSHWDAIISMFIWPCQPLFYLFHWVGPDLMRAFYGQSTSTRTLAIVRNLSLLVQLGESPKRPSLRWSQTWLLCVFVNTRPDPVLYPHRPVHILVIAVAVRVLSPAPSLMKTIERQWWWFLYWMKNNNLFLPEYRNRWNHFRIVLSK